VKAVDTTMTAVTDNTVTTETGATTTTETQQQAVIKDKANSSTSATTLQQSETGVTSKPSSDGTIIAATSLVGTQGTASLVNQTASLTLPAAQSVPMQLAQTTAYGLGHGYSTLLPGLASGSQPTSMPSAPLSNNPVHPTEPLNLPALPGVLLQQLGAIAGFGMTQQLLGQFQQPLPFTSLPLTVLVTITTMIAIGAATIGSLFLNRESARGYSTSPRGAPLGVTSFIFASPQLMSLTIGKISRVGSFFDGLGLTFATLSGKEVIGI
jgi:hypothetical protein